MQLWVGDPVPNRAGVQLPLWAVQEHGAGVRMNDGKYRVMQYDEDVNDSEVYHIFRDRDQFHSFMLKKYSIGCKFHRTFEVEKGEEFMVKDWSRDGEYYAPDELVWSEGWSLNISDHSEEHDVD